MYPQHILSLKIKLAIKFVLQVPLVTLHCLNALIALHPVLHVLVVLLLNAHPACNQHQQSFCSAMNVLHLVLLIIRA